MLVHNIYIYIFLCEMEVKGVITPDPLWPELLEPTSNLPLTLAAKRWFHLSEKLKATIFKKEERWRKALPTSHNPLCYLWSLLLLHSSCGIYIPATKGQDIKPARRAPAAPSASVQEPAWVALLDWRLGTPGGRPTRLLHAFPTGSSTSPGPVSSSTAQPCFSCFRRSASLAFLTLMSFKLVLKK